MVTDEGLPIAHEIYNGNVSDKSTLKKAMDTLKKRFQIKRCIFVGDRGLVSEENINYLIREEYPFIVALRKRNSNEVKNILKTASSNNYTVLSNVLHFKEATFKDIRYLICKNTRKEEDDKLFRHNLIKSVSAHLKKSSKNKDAQSKLKRAAEFLAQKKAKRYFTVGIDKQNRFFWKLNEERISYEKELDGVYILKTNVQDLKAYEVVKAYKNLCHVEDAFREIKDFLKLKPIYHYSPTRVKGDVLVCILAYLVEKVLEKSLKRTNLNLTPREAIDRLDTLRLVENKIAGQRLLCVTTPSKEHRSILKSVNIKNLPRILKA